MRILLGYPASDAHTDQIRLAAGSGVRLEMVDFVRVTEQLTSADIFCGHIKQDVDWARVTSESNLLWIQSSAAGIDHCLNEWTAPHPVAITSASGVFSEAVAEQAMALLLGIIRRIHASFGSYSQRQFHRHPTDDLSGKRVGIVGLGGNGRRIARVLSGFGVTIKATDYFAEEISCPGVEVLPANQLLTLARCSDVLIVTVPLNSATLHLIDAAVIHAMPQGAYLINVARGKVVDEPALIDALRSNHLSGAGLDVTYTEPLPKNSPLWELDNVIITPHLGAQSHRRYDYVTDLFCENLRRWRSGQRMLNLVDKQLGFPHPWDRWKPS